MRGSGGYKGTWGSEDILVRGLLDDMRVHRVPEDIATLGSRGYKGTRGSIG